MASFMEFGLLQYFSKIFLFLLIFTSVFALLEKSGLMGEGKKSLNSIISLVIAIFVVASKGASTFIIYILPWFFILALVVFFFIFIAKMFGQNDENIRWAFSWSNTPIITWVIIFVVLILVFGFGHIFGQNLLEDNPDFNGTTAEAQSTIMADNADVASGDYSSNTLATIVHPKVLGMIVLLVTGLVAILLITKSGF